LIIINNYRRIFSNKWNDTINATRIIDGAIDFECRTRSEVNHDSTILRLCHGIDRPIHWMPNCQPGNCLSSLAEDGKIS
jgi:hypothetical protein